MKLLGREDFVGAKACKRRFETYPVPFDERKRSVRLRSLTAKEHGEYEVANLSKKGGLIRDRLIEAKRALIALTVVDADGNPILTEADVAGMEGTDGRLVAFCYAKACEHCGITESEVEDMVKNSGTIDASSSATGSPKSSE